MKYKLHLYEVENGNKLLIHTYKYVSIEDLIKDVEYFVNGEVVIHPYMVIEEIGVPGTGED